MSLWSMNDGTALSHNITTNGSATVTSAGTSFITDGIKGGDLIVTAGGEVLRVKTVDANNSLTLAVAATGSESGVGATLRRPPINGSGITVGPSATTVVNDTNVFGITSGESLSGVDNVTSIALSSDGSGYGSAPSVTVAAPTTRTIATAKVSTSDNTITVDAGHNMRTGTKLTYTSGGTNMKVGGSNLADNTAVFVINTGSTTAFKIASSLSNALAGTAHNITLAGNNAQTFVGDTATATATVSGGVVTGVTVTAVGSDYQSTPSVTIAAPSEDTFNAQSAVSTANDTITLSSHAFNTGDAVTYSDKGGTVIAGLTDAATFFIIKVDANTVKLATTAANAVAGTAIDITAGSSENHGLTGATATAVASLGLGVDGDNDSREVAHVGWVKKTVGTGGRAGRVHYETLVAASSITGDAEDIATPNS